MTALTLIREADVAILTIDRPASRNSLTVADMRAVGDFVAQAGRDARCLLIRGAGGAFCAGRDLSETDLEREDSAEVLKTSIHPSIHALYHCAIPTIAAVEGPALGFGLGLALACDLTLAADDAVLGSPFRRIGCVPDCGAHWLLRERIGRHRALELIYGGDLVSGRQAAALGLVNRAVGRSELAGTALAMARRIAQGPTQALRASKEILGATSFEQTLEWEAQAQGRALRSDDGREGVRAFLEKRAAHFRGC